MVGLNDTLENFQTVLSREFWTTKGGNKIYAHEFIDEDLSATLGYLHRRTKQHRLDDALRLCDMIHRIGYRGRDTEAYYSAYKQQVDHFLDPDLSDEKWLKQNSKIYVLLLEEAKFRGIEIDLKPKSTKSLFKKTLKTKYSMTKQFIYNW